MKLLVARSLNLQHRLLVLLLPHYSRLRFLDTPVLLVLQELLTFDQEHTVSQEHAGCGLYLCDFAYQFVHFPPSHEASN